MPAIGSPHAGKVDRLARLFTLALNYATALVDVQCPLRLDVYRGRQIGEPVCQGL